MRAFILALALFSSPAAADDDLQSLLQRAVTVTCKLDETIAFYRDVLNQKIIEDSIRDGARVSLYVDIPATVNVRLVAMGGSGTYPDGEVHGGKLAFIGISDKTAPACQNADKQGRAHGGSVLFSIRVSNVDDVAARAGKAGATILVPPGTSGSGKARNLMMLDPNGRIVEALEIVTQKDGK